METEGLEQSEVQTSTESISTEAQSPGVNASEATTEQAQQIAELETLERFKFNGKEMTAKELNSMIMANADYTRKTQAMAKEREQFRFASALKDDLPMLKANPGLAAKFKEIYPKEYHYVLDVLGINPQQEASAQSSGKVLPPEYQELSQRLERIEGQTRDKQVQAISAELDNIFDSLGKKYPFAREKEVLSAAEALLTEMSKEQGDDAQLKPAHFEKLFKQSNDEIKSMADKHYSSQVSKQKQANARGRDVGPGGGMPGQAPARPKNIKEATALAMQEISNLT